MKEGLKYLYKVSNFQFRVVAPFLAVDSVKDMFIKL